MITDGQIEIRSASSAACEATVAHAVLVNARSRGGAGRGHFEALRRSDEGRACGLDAAERFDFDAGITAEAVRAWVGERLRCGARNFVAVGGDGTVHLLANALLRARGAVAGAEEARLGGIALGSSNDFHRPHDALGRREVRGQRVRLEFGLARPHDVGLAEIDGGEARFFLINASVGLTAEANWRYNAAGPLRSVVKRVSTEGAIVATALEELVVHSPVHARLAIDDAPAEEVAFSSIGVAKNVYFAGGMRYAEPTAPDDGYLGVYLCGAMSRLALAGVLLALQRGRPLAALAGTSHRRARRISIEASSPFALEMDGEVVRTRRAVLRVARRALLVCP